MLESYCKGNDTIKRIVTVHIGQIVPHFLLNCSKLLFLVQIYFSVSNLILIFILNPAKLGSI